MKTTRLFQAVTGIGFATLLAGTAHAADIGYIAASGNWTNAANWTGGAYPNTGDRAFIGGSYVGGQAATASVTVDSGVTPSTIFIGGVNSVGGAGTLTVQAGANVNSGSDIYVAGGDQGNLIQSGGVLSRGETWIGGGSGTSPLSYGYYNMGDGSMTDAGRFIVGIYGANTGPGGYNGIVTQTGGTITVGSQVYIGFDKKAFYDMSGGTLNQNGAEFWLTDSSASTAILNVSGTAVINANSGRFIVGTYGDGTVNQSGGTVNITTTGGNGLHFGPEFGGTGHYNLSGGTLNAKQIWITPTSESAGALNLTGGMLNAGDVYGNITDNGSTLAPGGIGAVGTTTMHNWYHAPNYVQNSGTFSVDLALASSYDKLVIADSGTATLGGNLAADLLSFTPAPVDTFTVLTASSVSGFFANAATSGNRYDLGGGNTFIVTYNPGSVVLSDYLFQEPVSAVPEPSAVMLLAIGGLIGGWKLRRK